MTDLPQELGSSVLILLHWASPPCHFVVAVIALRTPPTCLPGATHPHRAGCRRRLVTGPFRDLFEHLRSVVRQHFLAEGRELFFNDPAEGTGAVTSVSTGDSHRAGDPWFASQPTRPVPPRPSA